MGEERLTRGERNNNPGNIRETADGGIRWQGERATDDDKAFEEFVSAEDGIRALAKVLLTYYRKHGLNTIRSVIERWAPPNENDTDSYVMSVATRLREAPQTPIDVSEPRVMHELVHAIIVHENGRCIYSPEQIDEGVRRALA